MKLHDNPFSCRTVVIGGERGRNADTVALVGTQQRFGLKI